MLDYEEMAQPFLKAIEEPKARKLFRVVAKVQQDAGILDLEEFERVLIMLIVNNNLEHKERVWGFKYRDKLNNEQETDFNIIQLMKNKISEIEKLDAKLQAEKDLEKIATYKEK